MVRFRAPEFDRVLLDRKRREELGEAFVQPEGRKIIAGGQQQVHVFVEDDLVGHEDRVVACQRDDRLVGPAGAIARDILGLAIVQGLVRFELPVRVENHDRGPRIAEPREGIDRQHRGTKLLKTAQQFARLGFRRTAEHLEMFGARVDPFVSRRQAGRERQTEAKQDNQTGQGLHDAANPWRSRRLMQPRLAHGRRFRRREPLQQPPD